MAYDQYVMTMHRRQAAIDNANKCFDEFPKYDWLSWFNGCAGESAVFSYFADDQFGIRQGGKKLHDLELQLPSKIVRLEVKTQMRTVPAHPSYEANVDARQVENQFPDAYVFCSAYFSPTKDTAHCQAIEIVGWITKKDLIQHARLLKKGDTFANGREVTKDVYSLAFEAMRPMHQLKKMATA
jgi:hypothetical protein